MSKMCFYSHENSCTTSFIKTGFDSRSAPQIKKLRTKMNKDLDDFTKYLIEHMAKVAEIPEEIVTTPINVCIIREIIKEREYFRRANSARKDWDENGKNIDSR